MLVQMSSARKGNWSHTTRVRMLTAKFLLMGDWHYHFLRQLCESAPPVPLLILSAWNELTTWQFRNDWNSISQSSSSTPLLSSLLCASCFFIMSLKSFFLLCIFPFPGYILPHLCALLSCLRSPSFQCDSTLFFEVPISMAQDTKTHSSSWLCCYTWEVTKLMTLVTGNMLCWIQLGRTFSCQGCTVLHLANIMSAWPCDDSVVIMHSVAL